MKERTDKLYAEQQGFFTWWLCVLLTLVAAVTLYSAWASRESGSWIAALVGVGTVVAVTAMLIAMRLRTRIDAEGIHVKFVPFIVKEKTWLWEDIAEIYVRRYSLWDYGGWGYRLSGAGTALTTKGSYGIQIVLRRNGKRILIGTQRPEEVEAFIDQFIQHEK